MDIEIKMSESNHRTEFEYHSDKNNDKASRLSNCVKTLKNIVSICSLLIVLIAFVMILIKLVEKIYIHPSKSYIILDFIVPDKLSAYGYTGHVVASTVNAKIWSMIDSIDENNKQIDMQSSVTENINLNVGLKYGPKIDIKLGMVESNYADAVDFIAHLFGKNCVHINGSIVVYENVIQTTLSIDGKFYEFRTTIAGKYEYDLSELCENIAEVCLKHISLNGLAIYYYKTKKYESAIQIINQSLRVNSINKEVALTVLGRSLLKIGNQNEAQNMLLKAIETNYDYWPAWYYMGVFYMESRKDYHNSMVYFKISTELNPSSGAAWTSLGLSYLRLKDTSNAVSTYKKAIEVEPNYYKSYYNYGILLTNLKEYEESIEQYNKCLNLQLDLIHPSQGLAYSYFCLGYLEKSLQICSKNLKYDSLDGYSYGLSAEIWGIRRNDSLFYDYFSKAVRLGYADEGYVDVNDKPYSHYKDDIRFQNLMMRNR